MNSSPKCVLLLQWFPIIFVLSVFSWATYAYVVQMCIYMVPRLTEKVIYLLVFGWLLLMSLWCFYRATLTEAAKVPYQFYLTNDELQNITKTKNQSNEVIEVKGLKLRVQARTMHGGIRYCAECQCIKPDRSHHCSSCHRCILKMDHHCPWINNCVCYSNYKYFFLFLFYTSLFCLFLSVTSLQYFIQFWEFFNNLPQMDSKPNNNSPSEDTSYLTNPRVYLVTPNNTLDNQSLTQPTNQSSRRNSAPSLRPHKMGGLNVIFLLPIAVVFTLAVASLLLFHCQLLFVNQTTLESLRSPIFRSGPDRSAYNKGVRKNVVEVFGRNPALALLPINTDLGDGITFSPRISPIPVGYRSMESTPSNHHVINASVAMTPDITTEVVAVQPKATEENK